ncbi:MAG: AraC family transcriptional regulator [Porticoccaceae bacterium]|nr:AraC family transcriptional regulator [Pseudomonadales bacterium]MCP5172365.1 AraC family transcriptional regulator [Pseudomonadales bacterium]
MSTTNAHYAFSALAGAARQGIDIQALLSEAGIDAKLRTNPNARVTDKQLTRLVQLIWSRLEDEFMGFTASPCKQGCFAMMCQVVSHCENLEGLFHQGIRFYELVTDDIKMKLITGDTESVFEVEMSNPELDPDHFYLEFWLVIWHRLASWITGKKLPLVQANFTYPKPPHFDEFKYLYPCPCQFNQQRTQLIFSNIYLAQPLVRTSRELSHFLRSSPSGIMTIPGDDNSLNRKIKMLILNKSGDSFAAPDFDEVATLLNMSPQTLRRKLKQEGTSFQRIKDMIRRDLAIEKLYVQGLTVTQVAGLLGFAEPRSFTRAFKQWTGVSPSQYQKTGKPQHTHL